MEVRHEFRPDGTAQPVAVPAKRLTLSQRLAPYASVWGAALATVVVTGGSWVLKTGADSYMDTQKKVERRLDEQSDVLHRIELYIAGATERGRARDVVDRKLELEIERIGTIVGDQQSRLVRLESSVRR